MKRMSSQSYVSFIERDNIHLASYAKPLGAQDPWWCTQGGLKRYQNRPNRRKVLRENSVQRRRSGLLNFTRIATYVASTI